MTFWTLQTVVGVLPGVAQTIKSFKLLFDLLAAALSGKPAAARLWKNLWMNCGLNFCNCHVLWVKAGGESAAPYLGTWWAPIFSIVETSDLPILGVSQGVKTKPVLKPQAESDLTIRLPSGSRVGEVDSEDRAALPGEWIPEPGLRFQLPGESGLEWPSGRTVWRWLRVAHD